MRLNAILDKTHRVISRGDAKMSDLARFLDKNWNQCHEWLVKRNHKPSAEVALGMIHFVALNDKSSGNEITYEGNEKGVKKVWLNGKMITPIEYDLYVENNLLKSILAQGTNEN